jgi:metal-sulfur cluster biosynthetic enzyme
MTSSELRQQVIQVLRTIYDPEMPVNIYELGLIYEVNVDETRFVSIRMTLTAPNCPVAGTLPPEVEAKVRGVPDYEYMSDRANTHQNAQHVQDTLTDQSMPPGGPFWAKEQLELYAKWRSDGYQP